MGTKALTGLAAGFVVLGALAPCFADDPLPRPNVPRVLEGVYDGPVAKPATPAAATTPTKTPPAAPSIATGSTYTVVRGDTLSAIAARSGVSLDALIAANPQVRDPNLILPGDRITVPAASTTPAASTPAASTPAASTPAAATPAASQPSTGSGNSVVAAANGLVGTRNPQDENGSWAYWCLAMVNQAFKNAGEAQPELGAGTAQKAYDQFKAEGKVTPWTTGAVPPRGAVVFWAWQDEGHVAISNGDGTCVSTITQNGGGIDPAAPILRFGTPLGYVVLPGIK